MRYCKFISKLRQSGLLKRRVQLLLLLLLMPLLSLSAQDQPRPTLEADTSNIRIGEQIHVFLGVEVAPGSSVYFPEGQTFIPMEVTEEFPLDTTRTDDRWAYIKKYALTQFDSGHYTIPSQQIIVNNQAYYTDSLRIVVTDVAVDTTKQKMYDIKPLIPVNKAGTPWWIWLLAVLLTCVLIYGIYWFRKRKQQEVLEEDELMMLPPFDRALEALRRLDHSKYLIQAEYKSYYTDLTNILRSYLEDEVHVTALESTTDELITKLEMLADSGNLKLDQEMIQQFRKVLQTADLVKFAKQVPDDETVSTDRKLAEQLVVRTHEAIPEPEVTEEDEEAVAEQLQENKRKWIWVTAAVMAILLSFEGATYATFGQWNPAVWLQNDAKRLLNSEWMTSAYGFPAVVVETPGLLVRVEDKTAENNELIASRQVFALGEMSDDFYMQLSSTTFKSEEGFDPQKSVEMALKALETLGARNMLVKDEEFTTAKGAKGIKVYGSFNLEEGSRRSTREYQVINFVEEGGFQQLIMVYEADDDSAREVVSRIMSSIDFKTTA